MKLSTKLNYVGLALFIIGLISAAWPTIEAENYELFAMQGLVFGFMFVASIIY